MTSRIGEIALDCQDPERAARFWCEALGYRVTDRDETGVVIAGHSTAPTIILALSHDARVTKNRVHFDICPVEATQEAEVERLLALGASRIDIGQGNHSWIVLADPDGNEFCVMAKPIPGEPAPFHHLDGPN
jgi:catechol 2,3-dioxygenase-like lactoylglutathione lyase family enzyme